MNENTQSVLDETEGTTKGIKLEREAGLLLHSQEREVRQITNAGVEVMAKGMHPDPNDPYAGHSARMRRSACYSVEKVVTDLTDKYYSFQTKAWRSKLTSGKIKNLPMNGDKLLQIAKYVSQLASWNGALYDRNDQLVDLTGKPGVDVRTFFHSNILPPWKIDPSQTTLPEFDEDGFAFEMLEMLENMSTLADENASSFLAIHRWHEINKASGKVYAIGLGTTQGDKDKKETQKP